MLIIRKSCRGSVTRIIKSLNRNLQKYASTQCQPVPIENSPKEEKVTKGVGTIIRCKNESLNFCAGQTYDKFKPIPLASKGWMHRKSIGDYFVIYPAGNPENEEEIEEVRPSRFEESNINRQLIANLTENGLENPSEIQKVAIPVLLSGKNSIIAAETGCGKTLAYMIPLLEQIIKWKTKSNRKTNEPLGLIISPSRDLASQIGIVAKKISRNTDVNVRVIVGGRTRRQMINPLVNDVDLLIGSLGCVSKLTSSGIFTMSSVRHVVLDEADTLLDDSFIEKLRHFLNKIKFAFAGPESEDELPRSSQLTLVSATMPRSLPETLDQIINPESLVHLTTEQLHKVLPRVPQKFLRINLSSRPGEILKIVKQNSAKRRRTLVFCNKVVTCEWLHRFLTEMGINCICTHGKLNAALRSDKFAQFQRGHADILVTTDACSRGLDTVQVRHVVNFEFPLYTADYIHRCGRTGRLGSHDQCQVTNFISTPQEVELLQKMEMSVRNSQPLPNVDANISREIYKKIESEIYKTNESITGTGTTKSIKKSGSAK